MGGVIKTRFALGDQVWVVNAGSRSASPFELPCMFCRGKGSFTVMGAGDQPASVDCPNCRGRRHEGRGGGIGGPAIVKFGRVPTWHVTGPMTIGSIEVRVFGSGPDNGEVGENRNPGARKREDEERYMCWETGVGSGTSYTSEDRLFDSEEAAKAEAERRSEAALEGDGWSPSHEEVRVATGFLDHRDVYEHEPEHIEVAEQILAADRAAAERREKAMRERRG